MITRRDFLNGAALTVAAGATLGPKELLAMGNKAQPVYLFAIRYCTLLHSLRQFTIIH